MPAPSTIVHLIDADGDDFPIRVWWQIESDEERERVIAAARKELDRFIAEGKMRPTMPVTVGQIEEWAYMT